MEAVWKPYILLLMLLLSTWWVAFAKGDDDADVADEGGEDSEEQQVIGTVIGIDLGTTYSCVGVFKNGQVEIIANDQGNRITPSYVAFTPEGDRLIGDAAKNQLTSNPENTVFDVKRFIGRNWYEPSVQHDIKFYPFKIIEQANRPFVQVQTSSGEKKFAPEEISAMVLGKMKEIAEAFLGKKVHNAVITVPAYFNDAQRQATKSAGTIAGLNVLRIINEPTAAAIAYGLDNKEGEKNVLVFDLGGGTFDVSLLTIDGGVFEVIATNGDTHLGGEDFDQRVMEHFMKIYKKKTGKDIRKDNRAVQKLRREVEKAKRALSISHNVRLDIESFFEGDDFSETLTRAKFEELNQDLFRSTLEPLKQVLADADISPDKVHEIVLVGGSTRIPKIQELVKEFFNGKEPNRNINPDEAVAFGAAVQAGVLSGEEDMGDVVLLDVNPLTLGIETAGGIMHTVLPRNTVIPTKKSEHFSTFQDNQDRVIIQVYEGERAKTKDNHLLGIFQLLDIPPLPRGVPIIDVTFEIDVNGILKVTAEDTGTGNRNHMVIRNDQKNLTPEDIERMIRDSEKFSEEDKIVRERVQVRNDLEKEVYTMRYQLKESKLRDKLTDEEHKKISEVVEDVIANLEKDLEADVEKLRLWRKIYDSETKPVLEKVYARVHRETQEEDQKKQRGEDEEEEEEDDDRDEL